ncbi:MAG: ABC transporter permease [Rhodobacter sp.]|jgi:peptide/nickel transport system permease protein|nr:ABC transporter permease [Rhodobacter sp.]
MSHILREKGGKAGLVMVLLVVAMAIFGPAIAMDPNKIDIPAQFAGPSAAHWLGTDNLGRDLFARICIGLRTALITALLVVLIAMVAGLILGVLAGYFGGLVDGAMVILFDIISAFPIYIVIFAIVALYGTGIDKLIFVMALIFMPQFGRMARTQTQSLRGRSFIEAERLLGISTPRLLWRHFIPNIIGPMVVVAGMSVPAAITVEAAISFLGLGVQPPTATLGTLIRDGYVYLDESWWPTIAAALVLTLITLGSTLLAEAARDAIDPKLRGRT